MGPSCMSRLLFRLVQLVEIDIIIIANILFENQGGGRCPPAHPKWRPWLLGVPMRRNSVFEGFMERRLEENQWYKS